MKGIFYQGEVIVFQTTNEEVMRKFKELKANGNLNAYVNKIFEESVLHSEEKKQAENFRNLETSLGDKVDTIMNAVMLLQDQYQKGGGRRIIVSQPSDSTPSAPSSVEEIKPKEPVNASSLIKKGTKKKGLSMASILSNASKMKD